MTRRLKYPTLWPFTTATSDLDSSFTLYRYAEFGLLVREGLEIDGPYKIPKDHFTVWREGKSGQQGNVLTWTHDAFAEHRDVILNYAKAQFLINAFSVFEFLIANLIILIWGTSSGKFSSDGKLLVTWDDSSRDKFLSSPEISNIEDEDWMKNNFRSDVRKRRIRLLENDCGLSIRSFQTVANGISCDWAKFWSYEHLRHLIAHTAGRKSLYEEDGLQRIEITREDVETVYWYLQDLCKHLSVQLYEVGIFRYQH